MQVSQYLGHFQDNQGRRYSSRRPKTSPAQFGAHLSLRPNIRRMAATGARPTGRLERFLHILIKEAMVEEELAMWIASAPAGPKLDSVGEFAQ